MSALFTPPPAAMDLRTIAPRDRHALVFGRFDDLRPGQSLELLIDHDPQPLRVQFGNRGFGQFEWTTLESGPSVWRVQITRVDPTSPRAASDSCCSGGACCG